MDAEILAAVAAEEAAMADLLAELVAAFVSFAPGNRSYTLYERCGHVTPTPISAVIVPTSARSTATP